MPGGFRASSPSWEINLELDQRYLASCSQSELIFETSENVLSTTGHANPTS